MQLIVDDINNPALTLVSIIQRLRGDEFKHAGVIEMGCVQKRNVYIHSTLDWQKDDIEYAIDMYVDDMRPELYEAISDGRSDFLRDHKRFREDITQAVEKMEQMLY